MADDRIDLGPVRYWREGDILFAENDIISAAYVVTDDPAKVGDMQWHPYQNTRMMVEYISPEVGKQWEHLG